MGSRRGANELFLSIPMLFSPLEAQAAFCFRATTLLPRFDERRRREMHTDAPLEARNLPFLSPRALARDRKRKKFFFFPWSSRWGEMERGGERQSLLHNSSFVQYAPFSLFHLSSFALNHSPRPRPSSDGSSPAHFSQGRAFSLSIPNEALLLLLLCLRLCLCLRPCFVFDRSSDNTDDDALLCSFLQPPRSPRPAPPQSLRRLQSNRSDVCSDHQPAA